jgi:hypothetical protein
MQASVYTVWQQFAREVRAGGADFPWASLQNAGLVGDRSHAGQECRQHAGRRGAAAGAGHAGKPPRADHQPLVFPTRPLTRRHVFQSFLPVLLADWAKQPEVTFVVDTTLMARLGRHRLIWHLTPLEGVEASAGA